MNCSIYFLKHEYIYINIYIYIINLSNAGPNKENRYSANSFHILGTCFSLAITLVLAGVSRMIDDGRLLAIFSESSSAPISKVLA